MKPRVGDFKALYDSFVMNWVVRTIFAIIVGAAVGFALAQLLFCTRTVANELFGSILLGIVLGTFVGLAQASLLQNVVRDPKLWTITSIVGWAIVAFLFEINWPISTCITSSNAPSYTPGSFIVAMHNPIFVLAEETERMIEGETIYGDIYQTVTVLLMGSLMGVIVGVPQGIGQWWVLRKDMPRSSILIWLNALMWATTCFLIPVVIELGKFIGFVVILLLPIMLLPPALLTALVLDWLRKKPIGDRHT
jgi:hypothetical protein